MAYHPLRISTGQCRGPPSRAEIAVLTCGHLGFLALGTSEDIAGVVFWMGLSHLRRMPNFYRPFSWHDPISGTRSCASGRVLCSDLPASHADMTLSRRLSLSQVRITIGSPTVLHTPAFCLYGFFRKFHQFLTKNYSFGHIKIAIGSDCPGDLI